jgi:hypothetical protein
MATTYEGELELELNEALEGLGEHSETAHEFEHPETVHEFEHAELAQECESGEQFFGKIARCIGGFVRRVMPSLRSLARIAVPLVGTAIGGTFGAILGRVEHAIGRETLPMRRFRAAAQQKLQAP